MRRLVALSLVTVFVLAARAGAGAEFRASSDYPFVLMEMSGTIEPGDHEDFLAYLRRAGPDTGDIRLNSDGGDFIEAVKIGRSIHDLGMSTSVGFGDPGSLCLSACSFVFFGGVERGAKPYAVGVHRPYFDQRYFAGLPLPDAEARADELYRLAIDYLRDMEVPEPIIELTLATSSADISMLGPSDIDALPRRQRAYEEWLLARCGGLSAEEQALAGEVILLEVDGVTLTDGENTLGDVPVFVEIGLAGVAGR